MEDIVHTADQYNYLIFHILVCVPTKSDYNLFSQTE